MPKAGKDITYSTKPIKHPQTGKPLANYIGRVFDRLTVIGEVRRKRMPKGYMLRRLLCECVCGQRCIVFITNLRPGTNQSCGCWRVEASGKRNKTHGEGGNGKETTEYIAWRSMITRCENPNTHYYKYYGGRGIRVCEEWRTSYETFLAYVGRKPSPQHTLDRYPDNDGNYEPENVRWATRSQQEHNKRPPNREHQRKRYSTGS
jgi:hypothetical protein